MSRDTDETARRLLDISVSSISGWHEGNTVQFTVADLQAMARLWLMRDEIQDALNYATPLLAQGVKQDKASELLKRIAEVENGE